MGVRWLDRNADIHELQSVAKLTRDAYTGSDQLEGLPVPDGALETTMAVRERLDAGSRQILLSSSGAPIASACVSPAHDNRWLISRIAVTRAARGQGILGHLLQEAAEAADRAGANGLRLNAVVERCLLGVYLRYGFHVVHWWRASDKPLCEATMVRDHRYSHTGAIPHYDALPPNPILIAWSPAGASKVRVQAAKTISGRTPVVGIEVRSSRSLMIGREMDNTSSVFVQPRRAEPNTLTLWRSSIDKPLPWQRAVRLLPLPLLSRGEHSSVTLQE